MYFFGAFENLLWDSLKDTHGPIWNSALMQGILPYAYKTIPSLLFGAHEFTTPPSLSDLASFCVDICGESLFPHLMSGLNAEPILFPTRNSYQYFKPWLCDHLNLSMTTPAHPCPSDRPPSRRCYPAVPVWQSGYCVSRFRGTSETRPYPGW